MMVSNEYPPLPVSLIESHDENCINLKDLILLCFEKDPTLRISAESLLKHPFIYNVKLL